MLEFQEFKVFWEKMKKWIVCLDDLLNHHNIRKMNLNYCDKI